MRFNADLENNGFEILLKVKYPQNIQNGRYSVKIEEVSKGKTDEQRNHFMGYVRQLAKAEDSEFEDVYFNLLEMANIKCEEFEVIKEGYDILKSSVNHIKIVGKTDKTYIVKIAYGISAFDRKQLSELINQTERYASELGIYLDEY